MKVISRFEFSPSEIIRLVKDYLKTRQGFNKSTEVNFEHIYFPVSNDNSPHYEYPNNEILFVFQAEEEENLGVNEEEENLG